MGTVSSVPALGGVQGAAGVQYISPVLSPRQTLMTTTMPTVATGAPTLQTSSSQQGIAYGSPVPQQRAYYTGYPQMQPMQQVHYPQQFIQQPYVQHLPMYMPSGGQMHVQQPYQAGPQVVQQAYQQGFQQGSGHVSAHLSAVDRRVDDSKPGLPQQGNVHMLICGIDYSCDTQSWAGPPPHGNGPLDTQYAFEMMKDLAWKSGAQYHSLWNQQCTKEGIAQAIQEVASKCAPHDTFIFYYTGHGDRLPRADHRDDGLDECLCTVDANGNTDDPSMQYRNQVWMRDDNLVDTIVKATNPQVKCLVLVDACHSGTICDFNQESEWAARRQKAISITGCEDTETSAGTGKGGMFTRALTQAVEDMQNRGTYNVSSVYNRTLELYNENKHAGHTQSIAIHGCTVLPNEMAWPLQPKGRYQSPVRQLWRGIRGFLGMN